jgi:hypothetical protein
MLEAQVDVEREREMLPQNAAEIGHGQGFRSTVRTRTLVASHRDRYVIRIFSMKPGDS